MQSKQAGVELIAPVNAGPLEEEHVGRDQFTFDEQGHVVQCPKGHAPIRHGLRRSDTTYKPELHAFFDRKLCDQCPLLGKCASRRPSSGKGLYHMEIRDSLLARDRALALQRQKEWWTTYAIRSGVEATMSELKRSHGLGRLRVRRMPRVRLAVGLKVTACNVKRWLRPQREKHVQKLAK
ncbi:MAG: transposase [Deltaproteobacteria bacterium]|nr:transposase [Deltaproteobacteria bacterium]